MKAHHRKLLLKAERRGLQRPSSHRELQTLDALWRNGWITWTDRDGQPARVARLTDEGRAALHPPAILKREQPVHLTPARDAHCYTTNPAKADLVAGQVLDPEVLAGFTRRARRRDSERQQAELVALVVDRELLALEDRIKAARLDANAARIDLRDEFRLVRKARDAGDDVGVVRHLRRIERRVHRRAA